jgi:hypothetical protein
MTGRTRVVPSSVQVAGLRTVGCIVLLAACGRFGQREGRLDAEWTGADKGRVTAPATAVWCQEAGFTQLSGLIGDTGVSLLIHPADSVAEGRYRVVEPDSARSGRAAAVALRLLGRTAVVGYRSQSGWLTIERSLGGRLSGRFEAKAQVVTALAGTVTLTGRFRNVTLRPGGAACLP